MSIGVIEHELYADLRSWVDAARMLVTEAKITSPVIAGRVHTHVRDTFLRVAYLCNSQHPLFTLPDALLRHIVSLAGSENIWAISGICKRLRALCLATPSLWKTVQFVRSRQNWWLRPQMSMLIALHIQRSHPEHFLELRLSNLISPWTPDSFFTGLLALAMPRTRWLSLVPHLLDDGWMPWRPVLCDAAPALEVAILQVPNPPIPNVSTAVLPQDLFGGESPNLRQLTLSGVWLPPHACPALANLRYFSWLRYDAAIDTALLCQLLDCLPRLEGMSLAVMSFAWDSRIYLESGIGTRTLRHLSIEGQEASNMVECLKDLAVQCFVHRFPHPPTTMDAILDWSTSISLGLHICEFISHPPWSEKPLIARSLPLGFGNDCVNQNVSYIPSITRESFSSVTTLSIHEFLWPSKIDPGPAHPVPFPALRNLRIVLASHHSYYEPPCCLDLGLFTDLPERAVFHTPALHTLSLDHVDYPRHPPDGYTLFHVEDDDDDDDATVKSTKCRCDKALYVSLRDVHLLITTLVTGWRPRLSRLTLSHVEAIDLDAHVCEQLLHSIAEEVIVANAATPNNSDAPGYIWIEEDIARIFEESLI